MKKMRKILSLMLTMIMVFTMSANVFAAKDTKPTITITNTKSGHTYEAYQIFKGDLNSTGKILSNIEWGDGVKSTELLAALKEDTKLATNFAEAVTAEDVATVVAKLDSEALDAFAAVVGKYLGAVAGTSTENSSPYTIQVTGDGYYFVKDKDNSVSNAGDAYTKYILKVVSDVTVAAKADAPSLEKKIKEGEKKVDANNGSVGDVVQYELTSKVPNMDGYKKYFFIVHDTMSSGLTFNNDVVVKVGDRTLTKDTDYTVTTSSGNDGTAIEIVLKNFIQYKDQAGKAITITYSATINESAVIGDVGNPNTAHLEYSNNPNVTPSGEDKPGEGEKDVTGETPKDIVITYVTGIELVKTDKEGKRLTGAEFKIEGTKLNKVKVIKETFTEDVNGTYYLLKDGTYTETVPEDATANKYADTTKKYTKEEKVEWITKTEEVSVTATVGDDGVLRFEGLGEGTYVITEIKAPDGYNLLKSPITVIITCTEPTKVNTAADKATWKYTLSGAMSTEGDVTAEGGKIKLTVVNQSGAELPETGGIGTTIFYIVGAILVIGAAVVLITRRRMDA